MNLKRNIFGRLMMAAAVMASAFSAGEVYACTSAIISADASASGRPLLWKHRDTSTIDNKVEYVEGKNGDYSYVALFNASDRDLKEAWTGMNEVGFAVMNTASYNIKNDRVPEKQMDREGLVMTLALRSCRTVDDFEELLRSLPRPMGVEANFGVIDAAGNGAYFETNNNSYVKYDLKDAPGGVLIRTNYSHSGRKGEGYGYVREANAEHLMCPLIEHDGKISAEFLTEDVSRSFYHDVRKQDALLTGERWGVDEDFIPRYKSTATIVIEGMHPVEDVTSITARDVVPEYIMWTGLGYPPCAEIVPVWCRRDGVRADLRGTGPGGTSEMGNLVKKRRGEVFPPRKGGNTKYIDLRVLSNDDGTGYLQVLVPKNRETYRVISGKRDRGEYGL
ncbi:MAG: C45 family peptidase [Muribaculaceae bacterium]|nr:C45 family peptidase [Muribaculaceae bacterium]